jgi:hypothetical protein
MAPITFSTRVGARGGLQLQLYKVCCLVDDPRGRKACETHASRSIDRSPGPRTGRGRTVERRLPTVALVREATANLGESGERCGLVVIRADKPRWRLLSLATCDLPEPTSSGPSRPLHSRVPPLGNGGFVRVPSLLETPYSTAGQRAVPQPRELSWDRPLASPTLGNDIRRCLFSRGCCRGPRAVQRRPDRHFLFDREDLLLR